MSLRSFLGHVKKTGDNKFFVFYKDVEGKVNTICFQDGLFFRLDGIKKVRFINPLRVIDTLEKIEKRELKIIGCGYYSKPVDFKNEYSWRGDNKSWKIS